MCLRGGRDRIIARITHVRGMLALFGGRQLSPFEDEGVRLEHEVVEVDARLSLQRCCLEEEVHQHGLAAADRAPDVEPARACAAAEPSARGRQLLGQGIQFFHGFGLRRVRRDLSGGEPLGVELFHPCHADPANSGLCGLWESGFGSRGRRAPKFSGSLSEWRAAKRLLCRSGRAARHGKEDYTMTGIHRNGLSGLSLKVALIAFAALMFGCAPRAIIKAPVHTPVVTSRLSDRNPKLAPCWRRYLNRMHAIAIRCWGERHAIERSFAGGPGLEPVAHGRTGAGSLRNAARQDLRWLPPYRTRPAGGHVRRPGHAISWRARAGSSAANAGGAPGRCGLAVCRSWRLERHCRKHLAIAGKAWRRACARATADRPRHAAHCSSRTRRPFLRWRDGAHLCLQPHGGRSCGKRH